MPHKIVPLREAWPLSSTCELHIRVIEGNGKDALEPCGFPAVIWIRSDGFTSGLCQQCYDFCYPTKDQWYRVVKVAPEFTGVL